MLYQQWQIDYGPKPVIPPSVASAPKNPDVPGAQASGAEAVATSASSNEGVTLESKQRIQVETDAVRLEIDTEGGDIRMLELKNYPENKDHPEQPVRLFTDQDLIFIAQNGLIGDEGSAPNHHTVWKVQAQKFVLTEGQDVLRVPLSWTNAKGVEVSKVYILKRGSYDIALEQTVHNNGSSPISTRQYVQLQRKDPGDKNKDQFVRTYTGGVLFTPEEKYKKISFKDMASENLDKTAKDGWVAMIQHYFAAAWIPARGEDNGFYTKRSPIIIS